MAIVSLTFMYTEECTLCFMTWEVCKTTQKDGEITNSVFLGLPCLSQANLGRHEINLL